MTDLLHASATTLARAIAARQASSAEVVQAHLDHIARHNPRLNALVAVDEAAARRAAAAADDAVARGDELGPLHGVPVTLKEALAVEGQRTTCGFEPLANYVAPRDSAAAARLKAAGAIIIGRSNVATLLADFQTTNPLFGRTNNPWDEGRTPGGSSGGSAAAVAAGFAPLDVGTDLSGSLRWPAHCCGVATLKPTEHRVSLAGVVAGPPDGPRPVRIMSCVGPIARDVDDLALALRVLAGPDAGDTDVPPVPLGDEAVPPLRSLKLAWAPTFPGVPVAREIAEAIRDLATRLEREGARVDERLPRLDFGHQRELFGRLVGQMLGAFEPGAEPTTLADRYTALHERDIFIGAWDAFFEGCDALLCPVAMTTAFTHREPGTPIDVDGTKCAYWDIASHCLPFNLSGHPAVVLPLARARDGLPIGVQIVGKRWSDMRLLAVAKAIEPLTAGAGRPPVKDDTPRKARATPR